MSIATIHYITGFSSAMTNPLTSLNMTDDAENESEPAHDEPEDRRALRTTPEQLEHDERGTRHGDEQRPETVDQYTFRHLTSISTERLQDSSGV
jgi:hypothetical protein